MNNFVFDTIKKYCLLEKKEILQGKPFYFKDNNSDILAVVHCDTVFENKNIPIHCLETDELMFSPVLDDRVGVATVLEIIPSLYPQIQYDILITDDEEKGRSTASLFQSDKKYKWMFEFDRRGTGSVLYQYSSNKKFMKSVKESFNKVYKGSCSDISVLSFLGCCGLNVGTAYYDEHHINSYMIKSEYQKQLNRFADFYYVNKNTSYEYRKESETKFSNPVIDADSYEIIADSLSIDELFSKLSDVEALYGIESGMVELYSADFGVSLDDIVNYIDYDEQLRFKIIDHYRLNYLGGYTNEDEDIEYMNQDLFESQMMGA